MAGSRGGWCCLDLGRYGAARQRRATHQLASIFNQGTSVHNRKCGRIEQSIYERRP